MDKKIAAYGIRELLQRTLAGLRTDSISLAKAEQIITTIEVILDQPELSEAAPRIITLPPGPAGKPTKPARVAGQIVDADLSQDTWKDIEELTDEIPIEVSEPEVVTPIPITDHITVEVEGKKSVSISIPPPKKAVGVIDDAPDPRLRPPAKK
jgi:hypothetical protein